MNTETRRSVAAVSFGLLLLFQGAGGVIAAPLLVHFQGRVTNEAGTPLTSAQTLRFSLIQGGTASEASSSGTVVYQEEALVDPDDVGAFAHVLGSGTPVAPHVLEESDLAADGLPVFIEIALGSTPVLPRTRLTSAGYAIDASRLGGRTAAELTDAAGGDPTANKVVRLGAQLEWVSVTDIRVQPGVLGFTDGVVRENTTERIWSFGNGTGELGLDTGTEQATTVYYLYAVPDSGDDSLFSVVASTGSPVQVGGSGPTGFAVHRFIGSFFNNAGSDAEVFYRSGNDVYWRGRVLAAADHCGVPLPVVDAWVTVDLNAYQPETSRAVLINAYYDAWVNAAVTVSLIPEAGAPSILSGADWHAGVGSVDVTLPTVNGTFQYFADLGDWAGWIQNDASQCLQLHLRGYQEDLSEF